MSLAVKQLELADYISKQVFSFYQLHITFKCKWRIKVFNIIKESKIVSSLNNTTYLWGNGRLTERMATSLPTPLLTFQQIFSPGGGNIHPLHRYLIFLLFYRNVFVVIKSTNTKCSQVCMHRRIQH